MSDGGAYSQVADEQLDALEEADADLYASVLDACELIFQLTSSARSRSSAVQTLEGIVFRYPVPGRHPYKVFWTSAVDGPRIEAVFPHP